MHITLIMYASCQRTVSEETIPPHWVGPLGEEDVFPAGTKPKEGSLLVADKASSIIAPCFFALAAAMHLSPPGDQPGLHASRF